jgi:SNF2 family DNA or RNA helicase
MNIAKLDKIQDTLPMDPSSREVLNSIVQTLDHTEKSILPPKVNAKLRTYQTEGYHFLKTLTNNNCGALLADDMGLGKTIQALSCLSDNKGISLIVAPSSVLDNWKNEINKFTPHLKYKIIRGSAEKRDDIYDSLENYQGLLITSYALLRNDLRQLKKINFESVVLDEAHFIKNPESQVSRAARQINANNKIALSGTPLENSVDDLWTLMNFLNPGLLGSIDDFRYMCQSGDSRIVVKRLNPFMLRRTKKMAAPELPSKTFIPLNVEMSDTQNRIYKNEIVRAKKAVQEKSTMSILASLTRLRQIASHSAFGCPEGEGPDPSLPLSERSPKAAALLEKTRDLQAEGHSSLVFSQFTGILAALKTEMEAEGIKTYTITGETPVAKRSAIVDAFMNDPEPTVFLLSLKAAGTGLNLTRASYVFIFDPWWNPAAENQAIDRSHRIGQENPVIIYRLIASQSVEEKVVAMQEEKRQLFADLVDQDDFTSSKSFNRNELINLFDFN